MLAFFRKIRRSFIESGSTQKYSLYAIGEIALLVIGILIALQINNWNEERKRNDSIKDHLYILHQNLVEDQILLYELRAGMINNFNYADSLLMFFKTLIPYDSNTTKYLSKSLIEHLFRPNTNAFETITQSNEIPFLKPELQKEVLKYYTLVESTKAREIISNDQIANKYEPYIFTHYPHVFQKNNKWDYVKNQYKDDPRPMIKIDQKNLLSDKTLEAHMIARRYQSDHLKELYDSLITSSDQVLKLLENELKK